MTARTGDEDEKDENDEDVHTTPRGKHGYEGLHCICRGPSQGDMIACDNPACPVQWYHYECVGLRTAPKGRWFCPACAKTKNQSKTSQNKKNKTASASASASTNTSTRTTRSKGREMGKK